MDNQSSGHDRNDDHVGINQSSLLSNATKTPAKFDYIAFFKDKIRASRYIRDDKRELCA